MKRLAIVIAVLILAALAVGALGQEFEGCGSAGCVYATETPTPTPWVTPDYQNEPDIPTPCPWPRICPQDRPEPAPTIDMQNGPDIPPPSTPVAPGASGGDEARGKER